MKHVQTLARRAAAGNALAQQALEALLFVPHHLRRRPRIESIHRRIGSKFRQGIKMSSKTHRVMKTFDTDTTPTDYGFDRLMMLRARKERRDARV